MAGFGFYGPRNDNTDLMCYRCRMFSFFFEADPVPKQSVRTRVLGKTRGGRYATQQYQPSKVTEYEALIEALARSNWDGPPMDGPLRMSMDFRLARPKSRPKRDRYPDRRPDWLNLTKPVEDAIQAAGVITDDARIVDAHVTKNFSEKIPGVFVTIWPIPENRLDSEPLVG